VPGSGGRGRGGERGREFGAVAHLALGVQAERTGQGWQVPLGVHDVVVEGGVVRHHDQQRQPVVRRGPDRGRAHQEVTVAQDRHRQPAAALERERGAHGHPRPGADAGAAVHPQEVQRMVHLQVGTVPAERDPDQAGR
jgi:hypothetical protein